MCARSTATTKSSMDKDTAKSIQSTNVNANMIIIIIIITLPLLPSFNSKKYLGHITCRTRQCMLE